MTLPAYAMNVSSFPEMYERSLVGPLFRPWAEVLLQRVKLAAGDRVLDLACGTGIVARLAMERLGEEGRVVGVDVSAPMLAVASTIAPSIDWREGNASTLPIKDGEQFDVVACQQGLQFFSDKPAAAREMRRVLAPRGKLAVATWRSLQEIPFFQELHRVAERHVGAVFDQRYSFGDATALEKLLADAGFHDVRLETMSRTTRLPDAAVFVRMNAMAIVGMSAASAAMGDEERARVVGVIANESAKVLPRYAVGEGLAFEMSTNMATARG
jgi:ubiquinone/menaquinone biosynthesis C-methylase UbiE